jgi:hypothetical protein
MQLQLLHLSARDDHPSAIPSFVQLGLYTEASHRARVPDELYDRFEGTQGTPPPILRDMAEQAMFHCCRPASAVMTSDRACGYAARPIWCHQRRIALTAKLAVS